MENNRITKYLTIQDNISDAVGKLASWISIILVFILLFEVVMRYWFNSPTAWGHELSTMLFGAFGILTGTYTLRHRGHVRSEVIYMKMPEKLQQLCDLIVNVLILIAFIVFFQMAFEFAAESWAMREVSAKSTWQPVLYPIKTVIPIGVGLLILQTLAEIVRNLLKLFNISYIDPRQEEQG